MPCRGRKEWKMMKKRTLLAALLALCFALPAPALADAAGVLTETELNTWLSGLLMSTVGQTPLNAPVGEEALTQDGYAFMYDAATLYYDRPALDQNSRLNAISVTGETLAMPRNIRLGAPADMLLSAYGWQNPDLTGGETFAPLYVLDSLPDAAYWAWAQRAGGALQSVQCAIHANMGGGRYTDAGIVYTVQAGEISAIHVYGISAATTLEAVQGNLAAVGGDAPAEQGVTLQSTAEPFGQSDLQFGRMDFLTLTETGAGVLFGTPLTQDEVQAEDGGWLHTLGYAGASLVFELDAQRQNPHLTSLSLTGEGFPGPRGLLLGMQLEQALALFCSEGSGLLWGNAALLYGDGQQPPFGTLERDGAAATVRYQALVGDATFALHLTFTDGRLSEMMLYRN